MTPEIPIQKNTPSKGILVPVFVVKIEDAGLNQNVINQLTIWDFFKWILNIKFTRIIMKEDPQLLLRRNAHKNHRDRYRLFGNF